MRTWPPLSSGYSENFASLNRGKQSIALDLKHPEGLALARRLALEAEVLVENSRPGAMQRLGLGWDDLQARPRAEMRAAEAAVMRTLGLAYAPVEDDGEAGRSKRKAVARAKAKRSGARRA